MIRTTALATLAWLLTGCGGHYVLTIPDQLAPAGDSATVVTRLERNDFFVLSLPVEGAAMRYRVADQPLRAAYTDDLGYAATSVAVPDEPGAYRLSVDHMDYEGDEIHGEVPAFVWPGDTEIVAVDLDSLPPEWTDAAPYAREAVANAARDARVLYLTRRDVSDHDSIHARLTAEGYPDGPVFLWRTQRWQVVRGKYRIPRIVIETRLVSRLETIRQTFPGLRRGMAGESLAAEAFREAGLHVIRVGGPPATDEQTTRWDSWRELAAAGR